MVSAIGAAPAPFSQLGAFDAAPAPAAVSQQAATAAPTGYSFLDSFAAPKNGSDAVDRLVAALGPKPEITDADMKDEKALMKKKEEVQRYTMMVQLVSQIQQMFHDMIKAIVSNFR